MFTFLSVIHISFYLPPRVNSSPGTRGNTIFPSSQATTRRGRIYQPASSLCFFTTFHHTPRRRSSPRCSEGAPERTASSYLQASIVLLGLHKQSRMAKYINSGDGCLSRGSFPFPSERERGSLSFILRSNTRNTFSVEERR